jgi:hypothetical protein
VATCAPTVIAKTVNVTPISAEMSTMIVLAPSRYAFAIAVVTADTFLATAGQPSVSVSIVAANREGMTVPLVAKDLLSPMKALLALLVCLGQTSLKIDFVGSLW